MSCGNTSFGEPTASVKMEWFGWSFFRFTSPKGKIILANPFIIDNPDAGIKLDDITRADLILVPNGHRDEIGDTIRAASLRTSGWRSA